MDNQRDLVTFRSQKVIIATIFIIAFLLRLWFISGYSSPTVADESDYVRLAVSLINGEGYKTAYDVPTAGRPPGYPFFLTAIFFVLGKNLFFARIMQVVLSSLLCVLIYYLGRMLLGEKVGILSGLMASIHLGFIAQPTRILTEGLATFLLIISIIFFVKVKQEFQNKRYYFLSAFILGIASLVRSNFLLMFFFIGISIVYDLFKEKLEFKIIATRIGIYLIAFLLPIMPWTIRNYLIFDAFIPISTYQGIALYTSYTPKDGKIYGFVADDATTKKALYFSSEVEQSRFLTNETIKLLKNDPTLFFRLISLKIAYLFSPINWELIQNRAVFNYLYAFCFPFFLIGVYLLLPRFNELTPLYVPLICVLVTTFIFFGLPRFRAPIEPYMILLSSYAIMHLYNKVSNRKLYISFLSIFLLSNFILYLNSDVVKGAFRSILQNIGFW